MRAMCMIIHLHTICWNEIELLPYFLRHYEQVCQSIIVYDNGSNDGSQELVSHHPLCQLRHAETYGELREDALQLVKGQSWKESRGVADWVICCDVDEILYHPELRQFLGECKSSGITIPVPTGWQMVSDVFPCIDGQIYSEVRTGFPDPRYSKRVVFNPSAVSEIGYTSGCHSANPVGAIIESTESALKLLHFKMLGTEYAIRRSEALRQRLGEYNLTRRYGVHYLAAPDDLKSEFDAWKEQSIEVPL